MKTIQTEILINSDISKVWNALMDFENHPKWNPFIKSISGDQKVGNQLTVSIKPPDGNGMTFRPKILILEKNREFRWKGKLIINGIFDGEHFFKLESLGENQTRFIHGENFSGILVALMSKVLDKTKDGFQLMNESIKKECERK
ncbi:MAG: polyketide cyclase [Flavobacteriaceae bacterium]|nr:polyketide cyclase [Flavobacteriaceae bacterium]